MTNHASTRTTRFYDRRRDEMSRRYSGPSPRNTLDMIIHPNLMPSNSNSLSSLTSAASSLTDRHSYAVGERHIEACFGVLSPPP
jgi:hypothetical protein